MNRPKYWLGAATAVLVALVLGVTHGRADARVDRLSLRVDSLATTLTDVVDAIDRANPPPLPDTIQIEATGIVRGDADAPVTMVEFLDYQCPFCRKFHAETMPSLLDDYVDTRKLRIVLRDHPLPMHEHAMPAARAARCAEAQDPQAFWRFSDALLGTDEAPNATAIGELAEDVGLDRAALTDCMASGRYDEAIQADKKAANTAGLSGTPAFIIGPSAEDVPFRGRVIRGAYPIETFRSTIDTALIVATRP